LDDLDEPMNGTRRPDAVVIGGGVVGICAALYLQRTGRTVSIIERDRPGDAASGHNAGVFSIGECVPTALPGIVRSVPRMLRDPLSPLAIRWRYLPKLAPWLVRFIAASRADRVETIATALHSLTGPSFDAYVPLIAGRASGAMVHEGGLLHGYRDERSSAGADFVAALRTRRGVPFEVLDNDGIAALDPFLGGRFHSGVHVPESRYTPDPRAFTAALAEQFVDAGGSIEQTAASGFERRGSEVVAVTTAGRRVATGTVVIAAGAWSRRLVRRLGFDLPLDTERGYGVHLPAPGMTLEFPVICRPWQFAITPAGEGIRLAGTDELAGLSAPPDYARADRLIEAAQLVFPELRVDGAVKWMSHRPSLPDSLPVIGRLPRHRNVVLAFGHGHKGLTLGAITGQLVAELVDDRTPSVDLTPFRPTRFALLRRRRPSAA
jgi:D-amino-acid dehydrogenase